MQEIVDVVDENDTILYQLPKKEACEEKEVFHRIASVFVFLPEDSWRPYLQQGAR